MFHEFRSASILGSALSHAVIFSQAPCNKYCALYETDFSDFKCL